MIDKKEIVSWFKELESYKRIDAMYTLIGMCLPFELRFLGSVLEELGRRDSQELRGIELRVNNPQELAADIASCQNGEPTDKKIRRKMAIYLALIRACSRSCVNELFKTLEGWGDMDFVKFGDVENTLEELLLVYTMASLHPVFSFDQRNKCADILARIEDCQKLLHSAHHPHQTVQLEQHSTTTTTAAAAAPMVQAHMVAGHQHMHAPMHVLPPNYHYSVQQPPMTQMMHTDANASHPMPVDGIPLIHANLGIPAEYTVGPPPPGTLWTLRQSVQAYNPQQPPSIDVCYVLQPHPPQSPSPMLSQQSSPSQSRTASPSRSSTTSGGNTIMQQQQQQSQQQQQQHNRNTQQLQQQQQQQSQRNNTLRNSRRPSAETTPPPQQTMQQQQQQQALPLHQLQSSQLIIADMIPSHIKNLDDLYNPDGTLALQCRNGYTRTQGHHTIPRQSKASHHNQQQQQQQHHNQHIQNMTSLIGIGGLVGGPPGLISSSPLQQSGATTVANFNAMNAANITYQLHNMSLSDSYNPATATATILENNLVINSNNSNSASNRHHNKSGESDSGNSIGSSVGEISPPDTPAALSSVVNNSSMNSNNSIRLNDQNNFSKHNLNMTRLNGRPPDKLMVGGGSGLVDGSSAISGSSAGGSGSNVGTPLLYAPAPNSSQQQQQQQQQFIGSDLILPPGPNMMASPVANNNNNSSLSSTGNGGGSCSNNNLVTSTQVMLSTPTAGSGVVSNVITTNPVILQHQQQFSATYPYPAQHLPTTRPPILSHNTTAPPAVATGMPPPPLPYRHPGFQIPNGEAPTALYQYPAQVAGGPPAGFLLAAGAGQPPSGSLRATQPPQSQPQTAAQQQQQSPQTNQQLPPPQAMQPVAPSTTLLVANTSPYTTLTVGTNKIVSCFNCGSQAHMGRDCQEASMEDVTRSIYALDYNQSISPGGGVVHAGGGGVSSAGVTSNSSNSSSSSTSSSGGGSGPGSGISTAEIATETSSPTSSTSSLSNSNVK